MSPTLPDHISLSRLLAAISAAMDAAFAERSFWVVADVSDHKYYGEKGHHYFALAEKDPSSNTLIARVAAVSWKTGSARIRDFERITGQKFTNDINVLVRVTVDFHPVFGLKLTLQDISPAFTIGRLEQQRRETLALLLQRCPAFVRMEGGRYVTANQELEMKPVIQRIAVITSLNSAGFEDFRHTLEHNPFGYSFRLDTYYAAVQGIENARDLGQRFVEVEAANKSYDAVVLIRGGGSQTDFLVFDTFLLGEMVAGFPVPVITGIGHQVNETIVDLMAHTPLKTPTKAAEFIIARNRQFEETLVALQKTVVILTQQLLAGQQHAITELKSGLVNTTRDLIARHTELLVACHQALATRTRDMLTLHFRKLVMLSNNVTYLPLAILGMRSKDLENLLTNMNSHCGSFIEKRRGYLNHFLSVVRLMSPENILKKGFAIILHNNKIATHPEGIRPGDTIRVLTAETELVSTVNEKKQRHGKELNL